MSKVTFSNIRFKYKDGEFPSVIIKGEVTVITVSGFWFFKKTIIEDKGIYCNISECFRWSDSGEFVDHKLSNLISAYNSECDANKRLGR